MLQWRLLYLVLCILVGDWPFLVLLLSVHQQYQKAVSAYGFASNAYALKTFVDLYASAHCCVLLLGYGVCELAHLLHRH